MYCNKGKELQVLQSPAGYYIGTLDEDGFPNCRVSKDYYKERKTAEVELNQGSFIVRDCIENEFCGKLYGGCM